jgi:saccharopine dehydrogenase-like NADP-dependent oxidoreductase
VPAEEHHRHSRRRLRPGCGQRYAKLAQQQYFDRIDSIDILDVNAGSHGKYFATNFDPEINFREFTGQVWSWQNSQWTSNTMFEVKRTDDLPVVGSQNLYLTGHDEVHSLSKNLDVPNVRFWMSFGEHYINVFTVLNNLGLLSEQPVKTAEGLEVVPLKVVKAVLPDPASLARATPARPASATWSKAPRMASRAKCSSTTWPITKKPTPRPTARASPTPPAYHRWLPPCWSPVASGMPKRMANVEELPAEPFLKALDVMGLPTRDQRRARRSGLGCDCLIGDS